MKILKPGKVEMRKFVCDCCGCEFVATPADIFWIDQEVSCPQEGCNVSTGWEFGEPYEEPVQSDMDRLIQLFAIGKDKTNFIDYLIANGVTFREG